MLSAPHAPRHSSAAPGSKAEYSDIGFILLGEILSRIAR